MRHFARTEGTRVEAVGSLWAAYSAASGETALLNDESAAILEILDQGPAATGQVCQQLASDCRVAAHELTEIVEVCWSRLVDAGLVRELPSTADTQS